MYVCRQRSGNPGYLQGSNVLFGVFTATTTTTTSSTTTTNTINEVIGGFSVPAPWTNYDTNNPTNFGKSLCPQVTDTVATTSLNFGYDVSTGCVLRLNRKQFQQLCCLGTSSCSLPTASSRCDLFSHLPMSRSSLPFTVSFAVCTIYCVICRLYHLPYYFCYFTT